jgi:hypothetical protein
VQALVVLHRSLPLHDTYLHTVIHLHTHTYTCTDTLVSLPHQHLPGRFCTFCAFAGCRTLKRLPSLQSTSKMPKFINEFATFAQLEKHVATFDKQSFMVDKGALISEDNMFLLYRNFQVSCKGKSQPPTKWSCSSGGVQMDEERIRAFQGVFENVCLPHVR